MDKVRLILVGGFLGAGKTTLLGNAAQLLEKQGCRVGLIVNDQAPALVDSAWLKHGHGRVVEVAGRCFCCGFDAFLAGARRLIREGAVDTILAEPVGSCTDISATVLQPLKEYHAKEFSLAPFSVLVEPWRMQNLWAGDGMIHPDTKYILQKQLEEADWLVVNKMDLLDHKQQGELRQVVVERAPQRQVFYLSAQTGQGVGQWLARLLADQQAGGRRLADVDYDQYARGEAALGWLNAAIHLDCMCEPLADWKGFCADFMSRLRRGLLAHDADIGHVKLFLLADGGHCVANLTHLTDDPTIRSIEHKPSACADMVINARVHAAPEMLETIVRRELSAAADARDLQVSTRELRCLSPGRPEPSHRYEHIV